MKNSTDFCATNHTIANLIKRLYILINENGGKWIATYSTDTSECGCLHPEDIFLYAYWIMFVMLTISWKRLCIHACVYTSCFEVTWRYCNIYSCFVLRTSKESPYIQIMPWYKQCSFTTYALQGEYVKIYINHSNHYNVLISHIQWSIPPWSIDCMPSHVSHLA